MKTGLAVFVLFVSYKNEVYPNSPLKTLDHPAMMFHKIYKQ